MARKKKPAQPTKPTRAVRSKRRSGTIRSIEDLHPEFKKDGTPFPAKRELRYPDGRFKKGICLNPRGRGSGKIDLVRILAEELAKEIESGNVGEDMGDRRTVAHEIAAHYVKLCRNALKDNDQLRAIEGIMDRIGGKPMQRVEAQVTRGDIWDDMDDAALDAELARQGYIREEKK